MISILTSSQIFWVTQSGVEPDQYKKISLGAGHLRYVEEEVGLK